MKAVYLGNEAFCELIAAQMIADVYLVHGNGANNEQCWTFSLHAFSPQNKVVVWVFFTHSYTNYVVIFVFRAPVRRRKFNGQ